MLYVPVSQLGIFQIELGVDSENHEVRLYSCDRNHALCQNNHGGCYSFNFSNYHGYRVHCCGFLYSPLRLCLPVKTLEFTLQVLRVLVYPSFGCITCKKIPQFT